MGDKVTLLKSYTDNYTPVLYTNVIIDIGTNTLTKTDSTITISNEGSLNITGTRTITTDENINLITNNESMQRYITNLGGSPTNFNGLLSNANTVEGYVLYNSGSVDYGYAGGNSYKIITNDDEKYSCIRAGS